MRTSNLFVKASTWEVLDANDFYDHTDNLRKAVSSIVTYVNGHGGWSYVGWVRTGSVVDVSEQADRDNNKEENITSMEQTPHLSYLYPTDPNIVDNKEFEELQFKWKKHAEQS